MASIELIGTVMDPLHIGTVVVEQTLLPIWHVPFVTAIPGIEMCVQLAIDELMEESISAVPNPVAKRYAKNSRCRRAPTAAERPSFARVVGEAKPYASMFPG